ncbi:MAG: hypothetical protein LBC94_00485, partial [Desulfovibrio sp.]|nr:hypothetical protein [Desulfovibrio sp.]
MELEKKRFYAPKLYGISNSKETTMPHKDLLRKFDAMIKGTADSAARDLLESLQKSLAYCLEENAVL